MKRKKLNSIRGLQLSAVMTIGVILGLMLAPTVTQASSNPNTNVLTVDSTPYGMMYGE